MTRKTMLRDVVRVVEKKKKSLRDDPKAQELYTLLMAGRASERMDLLEELDRRIEVLELLEGGYRMPKRSGPVALAEFREWLRERDARLAEKAR